MTASIEETYSFQKKIPFKLPTYKLLAQFFFIQTVCIGSGWWEGIVSYFFGPQPNQPPAPTFYLYLSEKSFNELPN